VKIRGCDHGQLLDELVSEGPRSSDHRARGRGRIA
jgi:hypothetical protein